MEKRSTPAIATSFTNASHMIDVTSYREFSVYNASCDARFSLLNADSTPTIGMDAKEITILATSGFDRVQKATFSIADLKKKQAALLR